MELFAVQNTLMLVISLVLFVVKAFAVVDCVGRSEAHFGSTLPKRSWLIILGLSLVAHLLIWDPLSLLNLVGTVAAFVYLAQVRASV